MSHNKGAEVIRGFLGVSPFVGHLGMRIVALETDRATLCLPFTAYGRVVRRGRSLVFCQVEVRDVSEQIVAIGLVTYKLG